MTSFPASLHSDECVPYYQIGFPDVLQPFHGSSTPLNSSGAFSFHAYLMRYSPLHSQHGFLPHHIAPATPFVLLNGSPLDEDVVNHLSVRLNLPNDELIAVSFSHCGMLLLDADQVILNIMKTFNTLLFRFVLGRCFIEQTTVGTVENKIKGYYVMPATNGICSTGHPLNAFRMIDWKTVFDLLHCKVFMRRWSDYEETPGSEVNSDDEHKFRMNDHLILRSGNCKEDDIIDAFVTFGPHNVPCFIVGLAKDLNALSCVQGSSKYSSYYDYWLKRCKVDLKYVSQPLLVGYTLSHVGNFLQRSSQAQWCASKVKGVEVPPELCILQRGVKGCLWRGGFRLPSILCGLENALLAAQLRDNIGVQISAIKMQEALTSGAYNMHYSYERLELLGDSLLTLMGATMLYLRDASMNKDSITSCLHEIVSNKQLFQCAEACGLSSYVLNETFIVREWIPPGPIPDCLKSREKRVQSGLLRKQRISWRTLADVVEAIVGLFAVDHNIIEARKAMLWLGIKINHDQYSIAEACTNYARSDTFLAPWKLHALENQLKYHFKGVSLVSMALDYNSEDMDGGLHFCRLAYLGDTLISHFVAKHFLANHPSANVGVINEMKQSVVNKENLARVSTKYNLHAFLSGLSCTLQTSISAYVSEVGNGRVPSAYGYAGLIAPKVLGDLLPSIAAAIYLDAELDAEVAWKIVQPLMEPLPIPECYSLHPLTELAQFCKSKHMVLDIQSTCPCSNYETSVIVNQERIANFTHEDKRTSRKMAALQALESLRLNCID